MKPRSAGFSLVELIVALTLLSIGLIALAGSAAVSQRAFADAAASERAVSAAAEIIDSLSHASVPASGARTIDGVEVVWTVSSTVHHRVVVVRTLQPVELEFETVLPLPPTTEGARAPP